MKKTLLLGALAALAMTFTSCLPAMIADPEPFTITYKADQGWASPGIATKADWKEVEFEIDADADILKRIQFTFTTDVETGPASWNPAVMTYNTPCKPVTLDSKKKIKFNLSEIIADVEGATKITRIAIQNTGDIDEEKNVTKNDGSCAKAFKVSVKGAIATKKDGYQEAFKFEGDYGSSIE